MRFYEFGGWDAPVLLLLPGTCCHWKANFGEVIPLLKESFRVVCVSYDGFDEQEETVFPDMLAEAEKIEAYIEKGFGGHILGAYGCSLGGSLVGLLIQRGKVHIDHGILGSSDLDQAGRIPAYIQAALVSRMLYGMMQTGRLPRFMQRRLAKKSGGEREYLNKMLALFGCAGTGMAFVGRKSIFNQFYSDLVTPLEDGIEAPGTTVHCFYAEKMGEKYLARYQRHFKRPDIVRFSMQHEELLVCDPERWASEVRRCCGLCDLRKERMKSE